MNTNTFSGAPAGWNTLAPIRIPPVTTENTGQPAARPTNQLPSSVFQNLLKASPLPGQKIQFPGGPAQRPIGALRPFKSFPRPTSVFGSTSTPIRKPQRGARRSSAQSTARTAAISSMLTPFVDRQVEMSTENSSEARPASRSSSSSDRSRLLPNPVLSPTPAETPDIEMGMNSSEPEPEQMPNSSSEERHTLPGFPLTSTTAQLPQSTAAAEMEVCRICKEPFASKALLMKHIETVHIVTSRFICKPCGNDYSSKAGLLVHQQSETACKSFQCNDCQERFRSQVLLGTHECGEVCFLCNDEFANKFALQQHMLDAHKRLRHFQCPDCGVLFLDKPSMMRHQRSLTACKLFNCEPCLRKFASKELLDAHVCRAKGRNLVCPHCERRYTFWDSFAVHMDAIHARKPRFQCQACGVAFLRQSQLKKHLAKMMKCIPLPFKCEHCSRRFESQGLLGSHVCVASTSTSNPAVVPAPSTTTMGGRRPSPECTGKFNDPSALQLHIDNIRQKLKPYACTTCDKAFGTKGELTGHTTSGCPRLGPSRILLPGESFRPAAMPGPTPPQTSGQMPPLTEASFSIRQIGPQQFECSGCRQVFRRPRGRSTAYRLVPFQEPLL